MDALVVNHQRSPLHHTPSNFLQCRMRLTLLIIICHILLVSKDRDNGQCIALCSLIWESLASLDIDDVWLAVLMIS